VYLCQEIERAQTSFVSLQGQASDSLASLAQEWQSLKDQANNLGKVKAALVKERARRA
jgi:cell division protein FtsB